MLRQERGKVIRDLGGWRLGLGREKGGRRKGKGGEEEEEEEEEKEKRGNRYPEVEYTSSTSPATFALP